MRLPQAADRADVAVVGAAAAAEHARRGSIAQQRAYRGQLGRVAVVELGRRVELGVARVEALARRPRIRADPAAVREIAPAKCVGCAQFTM